MSGVMNRAAGRGLVVAAVLAAAAGPIPAGRAGAATAAAIWQRSVEPSGTGPQRLAVDPALLMASVDGTLRDLRLVDSQGREISYLLVSPPAAEGTWRRGRLLAVAATKDQSGFEVDLGRPLSATRLRLEGLPAPFLKRYRLEGSGDRQRWTLLVSQGTLFNLPDEHLQQLVAPFQQGEYRYLRVTWYDRQSQRLPLPGAASAYQPPVANPAEPLSVELAFSRRASEPRVSRFRLRLPGRLPVRALVLEVGGEHLLRRVQVFEAHLRDGALQPATLGGGELRRTVRGDAVAEALRIPLAQPEERELELQVEDGDNPPIELRAVRAELAPQPWIYFECSSDAAIVARCGDGRLPAPRYDLEAVRERLAAIRPATARWASAPVPAASPPAAETPTDPGPGGPIEAASFPQQRAVPAAQPGLSALLLDAEVLARSDLSDLRLANPAGQQVPYLLERREEPLAIELPVPASSVRGHLTTYAVVLPASGLPASRLVLETTARVFERRVQVFEESTRAERGGEAQEHLLAESTWRHADPETASPGLILSLPALRSRRVLLRVDEGDNRPLTVSALRLLLPSWRIRFFHPGEPLRLLYGRRDLPAPRYDLALLAPRLRSEPASEIALAPFADQGESSPGAMNRVFWIVLVAAVVVLLVMLGRLLAKPR
jgi:hypothetical protein